MQQRKLQRALSPQAPGISARGSGRWWLIAATSVLLAGCASRPAPALQAHDYRPVLRSTLVSRDEPTFVQARIRQGSQWAVVLARRGPDEAPVAVAVMRYAGHGGDEHVSVQFLPDASSAALNVLALEQLYALILRHEALGRYCFAVGSRPCDAAGRAVAHAGLLRELAGERAHAAALAGSPFAMTPWRNVAMNPIATAPSDPDDVAVQVSDDSGPMSGVTVYFNRAPHSGCAGKTSANGVAACRLVDHHGDDDDTREDARTPVVVTYPGDVRVDRVLLPTTFVLPAHGS
ncbi:MAG TPA: hypothetical protein VNU71_17925 [Burkholderiaceae bacterium]|nr:hypothetical protein [Burkholderiaceae bacterium]